MKPISYKLKNNICRFSYNRKEMRIFHKRGKEHGDSGQLLVTINYSTKMCKYICYGTIENPFNSLNFVTIQAWDELPEPENFLNTYEKPSYTSAGIQILDLKNKEL